MNNIDITLDQALAFATVASTGTIQKAAAAIGKNHSSVMYLLKNLESQTGLKLFDRSGYRNKISPEGEVILKYCLKLLETKSELEHTCLKLKQNWEPSLKIIYDGVVDLSMISSALYHLNQFQAPTEVKVTSAFLNDVEKEFAQENADMMVTIIPITNPDLAAIDLQPIKMHLVAHKSHPLAQMNAASTSDLITHSYVKIRDVHTQLGLMTENLSFHSLFLVNDFTTKKQLISEKIGFGWLPEYLILHELKSKKLVPIKSEFKNQVILNPKLYHRNKSHQGLMSEKLITYFKKNIKKL